MGIPTLVLAYEMPLQLFKQHSTCLFKADKKQLMRLRLGNKAVKFERFFKEHRDEEDGCSRDKSPHDSKKKRIGPATIIVPFNFVRIPPVDGIWETLSELEDALEIPNHSRGAVSHSSVYDCDRFHLRVIVTAEKTFLLSSKGRCVWLSNADKEKIGLIQSEDHENFDLSASLHASALIHFLAVTCTAYPGVSTRPPHQVKTHPSGCSAELWELTPTSHDERWLSGRMSSSIEGRSPNPPFFLVNYKVSDCAMVVVTLQRDIVPLSEDFHLRTAICEWPQYLHDMSLRQ
jgi:hypothetical protein